MSEPTDAAADYLMTIRYMHGEGQPVIAARLAERMGVSAATVSETVNRLTREGLLSVDESTRSLELTEAGRATAERTFRRHALSEWLLTEVVGLGWAEADEEAHHLQHALSPNGSRIGSTTCSATRRPARTATPSRATARRPSARPASR